MYEGSHNSMAGCACTRTHKFESLTCGDRWNPDRPTFVETATPHPETSIMKSPLIAVTASLLMLGATSAANAKGCIKGAVVGGVAGHYAGHHGVLGAAAGCLYGRHQAKERDKQQQQQSQVNGQGKL
jgi:hypothetical protein